jgi:hypothetical protein
MFFGAVLMGKSYVSYHLMPLYTHPRLNGSISPELSRRKQGKSCFNFRALDESSSAELATLTSDGLKAYRSKNWL